MRQGTRKPGKAGKRGARPKPCWLVATLAAAALSLPGCTTLSDYIHNGFKVGPSYARPPAPVAEHWIDANDKRVRSEEGDDSHWWTVLNDPTLNDLVQTAYSQNI